MLTLFSKALFWVSLYLKKSYSTVIIFKIFFSNLINFNAKMEELKNVGLITDSISLKSKNRLHSNKEVISHYAVSSCNQNHLILKTSFYKIVYMHVIAKDKHN